MEFLPEQIILMSMGTLLMLPLAIPLASAVRRSLFRTAHEQVAESFLAHSVLGYWAVRLGTFGLGLGLMTAPTSYPILASAFVLGICYCLFGAVGGGIIDYVKHRRAGKQINVASAGASKMPSTPTPLPPSIFLKALLRWTLIAAGGAVAIALALVATGFIMQTWNNRLRTADTLGGIKLGEKFSDVEFRKGELTKVQPDEKSKLKFPNEQNYTDKKQLTMTVVGGRITSVTYHCDGLFDYEKINGIGCGDKGEDIAKKFGNTQRILCSNHTQDPESKFVRVYDAVRYGTRYFLDKNTVSVFVIFSPQTLESLVNVNWKHCD